jgi:hypothetical protein
MNRPETERRILQATNLANRQILGKPMHRIKWRIFGNILSRNLTLRTKTS